MVGQRRLTLVRVVYTDNQPSRLQVISYRINEGVLTRRESVPTRDLKELDNLWRNAVNDTVSGQGVTLQSDVTDMAMRLWINGAWRSGNDVLATPAIRATTAQIPTGLEVTMQLRGHDTGLLKIFLLGAV